MPATRCVVSAQAFENDEEHADHEYTIDMLRRWTVDQLLCFAQSSLVLPLCIGPMLLADIVVFLSDNGIMKRCQSQGYMLDCELGIASLQDEAVPKSRFDLRRYDQLLLRDMASPYWNSLTMRLVLATVQCRKNWKYRFSATPLNAMFVTSRGTRPEEWSGAPFVSEVASEC